MSELLMKKRSIRAGFLKSGFAFIIIVLFCMNLSQAIASDLVIPIEFAEPNFFGLGIGGYPDYFGSDDYDYSVAPFGRVMIGKERFISLMANDLKVNILDHPNWRFGPGVMYRFGRDDDVEDEQVKALPEIDGATYVGGWGGYTWKDPDNIARRFGFTGWAYWDVSDVTDNGWTGGVSAFGMVPVTLPFTLAFGAGTTWGNKDYMNTYFGVSSEGSQASGLPAFTAGSGIRDVRLWTVGMLHLSYKWHLAAGVLYSRMLGDAADSPIVDGKGSKNQWVYGAGCGYSW